VSAVSQSDVSSRTYLPTAIAVALSYQYAEYPAATYYTSAYMRVIDLADKRVLASYRVDGSQWTPISMDSVISDFVRDLKARTH
jgi:hypothetical protein